MAEPAVVSDTSLRRGLVELRQKIGTQMTALARGLYEVVTQEHYRAWGYTRFADYLTEELEVSVSFGEKLIRLYQTFGQTPELWAQARKVPAWRLVDAGPVVRRGVATAEQVIDRIDRERMTHRQVVAWAKSTAPEKPRPTDLHADRGMLPFADALPVMPGAEIVKRSGHPGGADDMVTVVVELPVPVYQAWASRAENHPASVPLARWLDE